MTILFPYLRALTSVYTTNANVGTLILPPINVVKYLENKGEGFIDRYVTLFNHYINRP